MSNPLVVPSDLESFQNGDVEMALDAAVAAVQNYCEWHIAPVQSETAVLHSADRKTLYLPTRKLVSVQSVTQDGSTVDLASLTTETTGRLVRLPGYRYSRLGSLITVAFTHGYDVLPSDVQQVVLALAQRTTDNPGSRPRDQVGAVSTTYSQTGFNQAPSMALLDAEKALLSRYRLLPGV